MIIFKRYGESDTVLRRNKSEALDFLMHTVIPFLRCAYNLSVSFKTGNEKYKKRAL